jgi:hypothetical protein
VTYTGNCRCGALQYSVTHRFGPVINCHCTFCRRVHGAAFTTVAFVPRGALDWVRGEDAVAVYRTPLGNRRHFCGMCASPLFNTGGAGELAAIVVGSLQDAEQPAPWVHVNTETQAPWHRICDGLPEFLTWPKAEELRALAREQGCDWVPEQLLLPAT